MANHFFVLRVLRSGRLLLVTATVYLFFATFLPSVQLMKTKRILILQVPPSFDRCVSVWFCNCVLVICINGYKADAAILTDPFIRSFSEALLLSFASAALARLTWQMQLCV